MIAVALLVWAQFEWVTQPPKPPPPHPYTAARAAAMADGRPLVVLVGAAWCEPCRQTKAALMPQAARWHVVYIDWDDDHTLARKFLQPGDSLPQVHVYWKAGDKLLRVGKPIIGRTTAAGVESLLRPPAPEPPRPVRQARGTINMRGHWSWPGSPSAAALERHLAGSPHNHSPSWLATLSDSELASLHDADHQGRRTSQFIGRATPRSGTPWGNRRPAAYCPT